MNLSKIMPAYRDKVNHLLAVLFNDRVLAVAEATWRSSYLPSEVMFWVYEYVPQKMPLDVRVIQRMRAAVGDPARHARRSPPTMLVGSLSRPAS